MPRTWINKPPIGAKINWQHPLIRGLKYCYISNLQNNTFDLVKLRTPSGSPTFQLSPLGYGITSSGADNASTADLAFTSGGFSVAVLGYQLGVSTTNVVTLVSRQTYVNDANNTGWSLQLRGTGDADSPNKFCLWVRNNSSLGSAYPPISTSTGAPGRWFVIGTSDGSTAKKIYVNGKLEATTGTQYYNGLATTGTMFSGRSSAPAFAVLAVYLYNRVLNAYEVNSLNQYPYQFMEKSRQVFYSAPVVTAGRGGNALLLAGD